MGNKSNFINNFTWYPKDWQSSDKVFSLTPSERGIYRELIDLSMINNNDLECEWNVWVRRWNTTEEELIDVISVLVSKGLIEYNGDKIFIPSSEDRLIKIRAGKKGGLKSRPSKAKAEANSEANAEPNTNTNTNNKVIPSKEDLWKFLKEKKRTDAFKQLWNKIESWKLNDWKDLKGNKIQRWKAKINSQLAYIPEPKKDPNLPI